VFVTHDQEEALSMSDRIAVLIEALDDEVAARLAARVRPFLTAATSGGEARADRLLTVAEAATRAHVHVETIRRAVRDGRLAIAGRVGRSARIEPAELDRWLAEASDPDGRMRTPAVRHDRRPRQPNEYSLKAALKQTG
jgi:excisionase family DNA binding protein